MIIKPLGKSEMQWNLFRSILLYASGNKVKTISSMISETVKYFDGDDSFERVLFYDFSENLIYSLIHYYESNTFDFVVYNIDTGTSVVVNLPSEKKVESFCDREAEVAFTNKINEIERQKEAMKMTKEEVLRSYEIGRKKV